jgi:sensor histidine kinase regulating citrate/malate metabolism
MFFGSLRKQTDIVSISLTNAHGIILFHPDSRLLGTKIDKTTALRVLEYGDTFSRKTYDNGHAFIQGSVPVIDERHNIIGMVSVGYPVDPIRKTFDTYLEKIIFFIFVFITLGLVAAIFIAKGVKWIIFGLEPAEIAYMFKERTALIESTREGIISTDANGLITLVNRAALKTLNIKDRQELIHQHIHAFFPNLDIARILNTGEPVSDREYILAGIPIIINVESVGDQNGLVVTFRKKEDIDIVARELSQVQTFSDMLRAQTHEYSNSLHSIVGLIQIGAYDEVLDFIADETKEHRELIRFLTENLPDKTLSSMIIGKYMHASEQKVDFKIDPESRMIDLPNGLDRHTLNTVLGNILDNAIEAARAGDDPAWVTLFMSDFGHDLIFEIEDSGCGIDETLVQKIFEKGVSSKTGTQRGYGLYLAKKAIDTLGGTIDGGRGDAGGTRFEVIIPKKRYKS